MTDQWAVMQVNGTIEYEIIKGLKARGLFSYSLANRRLENREYSYNSMNMMKRMILIM